MIEIEARSHELPPAEACAHLRRVSGPQGPHVVIDGHPVLLLCSDNYLGLADHPRVRQAAGEAAMRWGVGAGASRTVSGTMTIHRRLEERLAEYTGHESTLLFGSTFLAHAGVIAALAGAGDVVFCDELSHAAIVDGCHLSQAEVFVYEHCDTEHLAWGIEQAEGRAALIATDSVFSRDGDLAPLPDIVELACRHRIRLLLDESHAIGTLGPGGRGALAQAGLEQHADVIVGTLGKSLGAYGAFVLCHGEMSNYLINAAHTFALSTALAPPVVAGALAALELIDQRPRLLNKLYANVATLREALTEHGFEVGESNAPIMPVTIGDAELAGQICEAAFKRGVLAQALRPPTVAASSARLRLTVMASHRHVELRAGARALAAAARAAGFAPPGAWGDEPPAVLASAWAPDEQRADNLATRREFESAARAGVFDFQARAA